MKPTSPIKKSDIARSFSDAAINYDQYAFIQKEIGKRLLERLTFVKKTPTTIVDCGAGTGFLTRQMQQQFPQSKIIGLDFAEGMMKFAKMKQSWHLWKKQPHYLCADIEKLPLADRSVDLIFSNFTLQWCFALDQFFIECKRVLKDNGLLFFSTLGPQTLYELRQSWSCADNFTHVNDFLDMHDIGDLLVKNRFAHPVMDMEMITLTYPSVTQLLKELKATGARNMHINRSKGFTSKGRFHEMLTAYTGFKQADVYPASFEVIYGHAWMETPHLYRQEEEDVVRIPANKIPLIVTNG